jgi:hypothetical protein
LPHPNARGVVKTFSRSDLSVLQSVLAGRFSEARP